MSGLDDTVSQAPCLGRGCPVGTDCGKYGCWELRQDAKRAPAVPVGAQPEPAERPCPHGNIRADWCNECPAMVYPAEINRPNVDNAERLLNFYTLELEPAVVHPEPGRLAKAHHPKCFQSTRTPEQLVAQGLAPDQCDCGTLRLLDAVTDLPDTVNLSSWMETPHRIAVDGHGYVWRAYTGESYWSMAPVNPDNSPVPQPVVYYVPESEVAAAVAAVRADLAAKVEADAIEQWGTPPLATEVAVALIRGGVDRGY